MVPRWNISYTDENGKVFNAQFMIPQNLSEDDNDKYMAEALGASVISINKAISGNNGKKNFKQSLNSK